MNPKIFVFVAVLALGAILGGILLSGPTMVAPTSENTNAAPTIELLEVDLVDISVTKINERSATIEIAFEIFNPNPRAVIVQTMDYNLFETGFSSSEQLAGGTIGSRPEGMVEFGSDYYVLLGNNSIILKEKFVLKGSENTPELWSILKSGDPSWRVTGDGSCASDRRPALRR